MDAKKLDIITKLLAKAERAGTPEESETFYAKAQELMAKWAIDEAMLRSSKKSDEKVITKVIELNKSGQWKANVNLVFQLGKPNDVRVVFTEPHGKGSKPKVHMVGFESDIANVEMLFTSMLVQSSRFRREMMPEHIRQDPRERLPWVRSFIDAFANRIGTRLMENKKLAEQTYGQEEYGSSLLPVLASKSNQVDQAYKRIFPNTKVTRSRSKVNFEGAEAGYQAGNRADIGSTRIGTDRKALGS